MYYSIKNFFKFFGTKIAKKNFFLKFISRRGSKNLPLTVFLAEKTEPNYDAGFNADADYSDLYEHQWLRCAGGRK
jgi:hypothetical protein